MNENKFVPNWFVKRWDDVRRLQFKFDKESLRKYLRKFMDFLDKRNFEIISGGEYTLKYIKNILHAILKYKWQSTDVFMFHSKQELQLFIEHKLNLGAKHAKSAWLLKGILISYKYYVRSKWYKENPFIFDYFYTVLYHTWFCKDKIKLNKCLLIKSR